MHCEGIVKCIITIFCPQSIGNVVTSKFVVYDACNVDSMKEDEVLQIVYGYGHKYWSCKR